MNINRFILLISFLCIGCLIACNDDEDDGPDSPPINELPKISISSVTLFEGNENTVFRFKVSTSQSSDESISVDFTTEEITAGFDIDFIAQTGTLTIPAYEVEGFIEIEVVADEFKEQDESFKVILSNPVNATITNAEGVGTIRNDDTYVFVPEDGYITPENYTGYTMVWGDEFNESSIDQDNWTHEIGASGWGNNESQYYTSRSENSFMNDGNLVIEAKEESYQGSPYTSARMISKDKQEFAFGRVDIRAILPEGQGIWPALWMLGANINDSGWPVCGEIDIMELIGHEPSTIHGTAHWGPPGSTSIHEGEPYTLSGGAKFSEEYHVFSIIWEPNSIKWLVDDNEYFSISPSIVNGSYPFNAEFFFILNIAVGGNWPGYPDASTAFPQRMYIDYIRVFQEN